MRTLTFRLLRNARRVFGHHTATPVISATMNIMVDTPTIILPHAGLPSGRPFTSPVYWST